MQTLKFFRKELANILIACGTKQAKAMAEELKEKGLYGYPTEDEIEKAMELL